MFICSSLLEKLDLTGRDHMYQIRAPCKMQGLMLFLKTQLKEKIAFCVCDGAMYVHYTLWNKKMSVLGIHTRDKE